MNNKCSLNVLDNVMITLDVDWAPDFVLEFVLELLLKYNVKATFFATHDSSLLRGIDKNHFEVGIHPNFNGELDHEKIIDQLLAFYPKAKGERSHSLFQSSHLIKLLKKKGIKYEVNTYLPLCENIRLVNYNGILKIPFYWEDDTNFVHWQKYSLLDYALSKKGLKIFNFHPIHIYLNTNSQDQYALAKKGVHNCDREHLDGLIFRGAGTRSFFVELLEYLKNNNMGRINCLDLCGKLENATT